MEIEESKYGRRKFIKHSIIAGTMAGFSLMNGCKGNSEEKEVSPPEDLMQEHGLLNRVLLIYDECKMRLYKNNPFPPEVLRDAAGVIKEFVEDYHEKQEENYLFPRFEKVNQLTELVQILRQQHKT